MVEKGAGPPRGKVIVPRRQKVSIPVWPLPGLDPAHEVLSHDRRQPLLEARKRPLVGDAEIAERPAWVLAELVERHLTDASVSGVRLLARIAKRLIPPSDHERVRQPIGIRRRQGADRHKGGFAGPRPAETGASSDKTGFGEWQFDCSGDDPVG